MKKFTKEILSGCLSMLAIFAFPILLFTSGFYIYNGAQSVETHTDRCLEKSISKYRVGAICADGWRSSSTGRGTCSHHGGVSKWLYNESPTKTRKECEELARKLSWRD